MGSLANTAGGWVWPPDDVNVSEAVAAGNYAELVRLLENGEDPTRSGAVRAPLLASEPVVLTPLEAAVLVRNATMMQLLLTRGAVLTRVSREGLSASTRSIRINREGCARRAGPGRHAGLFRRELALASRTGSSGWSDTLRCYVSTMLVYRTGLSAPAGSIVPLAPVWSTFVPSIVIVSIGPELETT